VSSRPTVVVLGATPDEAPPGIDRASADVELRFVPDGGALPSALRGVSGLFFWRAERAWLEAAWPRVGDLRWIQAASDGVDGLLFPELVASEVLVTNSRGVFDDAIAEWVIGAMLAFTSGILRQRDAQQAHEWAYGPKGRVAGARLVVVGPGPIGRATAVRAKALGMGVTAVGRSARDDDVFGLISTDLHASLAGADFVLDALPLTAHTRQLFGARAFAAMPQTARFINVGRGSTVDEQALIRALSDGDIVGAALDVFETEPLPADSPLWSMPQVLVSPHMGGDFEGWESAVVDVFVENCGRFARGQPLRNQVDKAAGFGAADTLPPP
jgi:phosphoglycerate dehydrogenase-like enzyme